MNDMVVYITQSTEDYQKVKCLYTKQDKAQQICVHVSWDIL